MVEPGGGDGHDRGAMMVVVGHTLMNSISAVLGLLDTLIDRYPMLSDDDRRELLARIRTRIAYDFEMLLPMIRIVSFEDGADTDQPT